MERPNPLFRQREREYFAVRASNSTELQNVWRASAHHWVVYGERLFRHLLALQRHGYKRSSIHFVSEETLFEVTVIMSKVLWMITLVEERLYEFPLFFIHDEDSTSDDEDYDSDDEAQDSSSDNEADVGHGSIVGLGEDVFGIGGGVGDIELDTVIEFDGGDTGDEVEGFVYV